MRRSVAPTLALLALASVASAEEVADTSYLEREVRLVTRDADLATIASALAASAGVRVDLAPSVEARHAKVSVAFEGVKWLAALEQLARENGLRIAGAPAGVVLTERRPPARVTLSERGASLRRAIAEIVRAGPMSLVVGPEVQGTVDLDVKDEPWTRALGALLRDRGLHAVVRGRVLLISARGPVPGEVELDGAEPDAPVVWPLRRQGEPDRLVDVVVEDASPADVAAEIGRRVGRNVVVEPAVVASVTVALRRCPWREALDRVAADARAYVHEASGVTLLRRHDRVTLERVGPASEVLHAVAKASGHAVVVGDVPGELLVNLRAVDWTAAISAIGSACGARVGRVGPRGEVTVVSRALDPARLVPYDDSIVDGLERIPEALRGHEVDVSVEEADLRDVVAELAARVDRTFAIEHEISERSTVTMRKIPARFALELVARLGGCRVKELPGHVPLVVQPARVELSFRDQSARTIVQLLGAYAGRNVLVAGDVAGRITLDVRGVDWDVALRAIALALGLHLSEHRTGVVIVSATPSGPEPGESRTARWRALGRRATPWRWDLFEPIPRWIFEEADLRDAVAEIGESARCDLRVAPDIREKVTCSLRRLDWRDALEVLASLTKCEIRRRGDAIVFEQTPKTVFMATNVPVTAWRDLMKHFTGAPAAVSSSTSGSTNAELTFDLQELSFADACAVIRDVPPVARPRVTSLRSLNRREAPKVEAVPEAELETEAALLMDKVEDGEATVDEIFEQDYASLFAKRGGIDAFEKKLRAWHKNGGDELRFLGLRLMICVERGNGFLRAMLRAKQDGRYEEVPAFLVPVKELVADMKKEIRQPFHDCADKLLEHAEELADLSARVARIAARVPCSVRAVAIDHRPGGKKRTVIVSEPDGTARVYAVGDALVDAAGRATDVKVGKIEEGLVTLRQGETELLVQVAAPED